MGLGSEESVAEAELPESLQPEMRGKDRESMTPKEASRDYRSILQAPRIKPQSLVVKQGTKVPPEVSHQE